MQKAAAQTWGTTKKSTRYQRFNSTPAPAGEAPVKEKLFKLAACPSVASVAGRIEIWLQANASSQEQKMISELGLR
jgi:hypothetical protein